MTEVALNWRQRWWRNLVHSTSPAVHTPSVALSLLAVAVGERIIDYSFPAPLWHCVTVGIVAWASSFWIPLVASHVMAQRSSRPIVVLASYVISGVVFALIVYWGLADHAPAHHPEATLLGRLTVLLPSRVALWLGITYLADASDRLVARRRDLSSAQSQSLALLAAAGEQVSQIPDAAARDVRAALIAEVTSIRSSKLSELDQRLFTLIENVVRPMSQRLASQLPRWRWDAHIPDTADQRHLTQQLLAGVDARSDLRPGLIAALFGVLATSSAVVTLGVQGGVMAVLGTAVGVYAGASLCRYIPTRYQGHMALAELVLRAGGISAVAGALMTSLALGHPRATTLGVQVGATIFVITVALGLALSGSRVVTATDEQLVVATENVAWRTARLHAQSWVTQHGLAMKLHGSVQSAMQACLLRLRTDATPADIEQVLADLEASLDVLLAAPESPPLVIDQLRNIADTWRGIAEVTWRLSLQDAGRIDADSTCATVVHSVLQDSVSNSVRHGEATHVTIDIEVVDDLVCLTIINDGEAVRQINAPGFGTAQLEACAIRWERNLHERPTRLYALLPLAVSPAATA